MKKTLLAGATHKHADEPAGKATSRNRLRVATYNIHKGVSAIWRQSRIPELRSALQRIDADIVFLQEVQERHDLQTHPGASQLDQIAGCEYGYFAYGANAFYPHGHHGNAILSRLPIEHSANHDISDHRLERRGVLHAIAELPGDRRIHLLCVHLGLIKGSRTRQADWLTRFIEREIPDQEPLILAGDFNDWRRGVDARLRTRLGLRDAFHPGPTPAWLDTLLPWRRPLTVARTYPSMAPLLTLDRIYLRGVRARSSLVPRGAGWARCSDHAPLIADLETG